jgi:glutathione-regulated potassium-efflux system ancillary protein KefG
VTDTPEKPKILVLFAHPYPHLSRVNRTMADAVRDLAHVTFHDLYERYPDFFIDVKQEQALLSGHDVVVMQHPFYWYSCPSLLKEWMDSVLEYGWAYGTGGNALHGKELAQAVSTGGPDDAYSSEGYNRITMTELLRPFERSAALCGMTYRAPFLLQGARLKKAEEVAAHAAAYRTWLNDYPNPKYCPGCDVPDVPEMDR